jgi:hypothetical protein
MLLISLSSAAKINIIGSKRNRISLALKIIAGIPLEN